jgi:predicted CoA-binding protein
MPIESDDALRELLERVQSIAVVGIKAGPADDAFRVPRYMQEHGRPCRPRD